MLGRAASNKEKRGWTIMAYQMPGLMAEGHREESVYVNVGLIRPRTSRASELLLIHILRQRTTAIGLRWSKIIVTGHGVGWIWAQMMFF